jgi:hypothetical protein
VLHAAQVEELGPVIHLSPEAGLQKVSNGRKYRTIESGFAKSAAAAPGSCHHELGAVHLSLEASLRR